MASLASIRTAIKTTLETAMPTSIKVYPQIESVNTIPPGGAAVVVVPVAGDFLVAMGRGTDTWTFDLLVMVPASSVAVAQTHLDDFVTGDGANSIREAIFNARTLGLSNTDAHVAAMAEGSYGGRYESASVDHIGATLTLIVHTTGTA